MAKKTDINWKAFIDAYSLNNQSLCVGEVETLTEIEVNLINLRLEEVQHHSKRIRELFDEARTRFRGGLIEKKTG